MNIKLKKMQKNIIYKMITIFEEYKNREDYTEIWIKDIYYKYGEINFENMLNTILLDNVISYTCAVTDCCKEERYGKVNQIVVTDSDCNEFNNLDNIVIFIMFESDEPEDFIQHEVDIYKSIKYWIIENDAIKYNL